MLVETANLATGFTIGICASDSAVRLPDLLSFAKSEAYGRQFRLEKVVVVASAIPPTIISETRRVAGTDKRFELLVEPERRGKAQAINEVIERSTGEYLVMLNADAFPEPGSIREMLLLAEGNLNVGCVSALPVFEEGQGMLRRSLTLMWSAHSQLSLGLNHAGVSNHACDELMIVRRSLVPRLPSRVVNDGAYIGGLVRAKGYHVRFSDSARVRINVPSRFMDLVRQRRRILFGHVQVWKRLRRPPKTVESMLFIDPLVSLRTVVRLLSSRPRLIYALPVVVAAEIVSALLATWDTINSTGNHSAWRRIHE